MAQSKVLEEENAGTPSRPPKTASSLPSGPVNNNGTDNLLGSKKNKFPQQRSRAERGRVLADLGANGNFPIQRHLEETTSDVSGRALAGVTEVPGGKGRGKAEVPGGKGHGRGRGKPKANGKRKRRHDGDAPILSTPIGWVQPAIQLANRHSPPTLRPSTQRRRVVRNLLQAVNSVSTTHGADRLIPQDVHGIYTGEECHTPPCYNSEAEGAITVPRDCKEAPQVTCCSKGKRPVIVDDSGGWYTSCDSEGCHSHGRRSVQGLDDFSPMGEGPKKFVLIAPAVLGLSPTRNGGSRLRGEETREFLHAVTGDETLLVDFEGVIGVQAVPKTHCFEDDAHGAGPSELPRRSTWRSGGHGTTQQQLLSQFEGADEQLEGLTPFLVAGDLELPPLSPTGHAITGGTHSPVFNVTYPNYLLPIGGSSSDEECDDDDTDDDPDWSARYADFAADSDEGNSDWELEDTNMLDEVGPVDDIPFHECSFESRYAEGHWDSMETTLLGDRKSFFGPKPGPTRRPSRR